MSDISALHHHFLEAVKPAIERQAKKQFGQYLGRNPEQFEESKQAALALAWKRYLQLIESGKNPDEFLETFARRACQGVRNGRRIDGTDSMRDVTSVRSQLERGHRIEPLPDFDSGESPVVDALRDNSITPVPEQVGFRVDFPRWLDRISEKKRAVVESLMAGDTTAEAAEKHGVSWGRVSQIRREAKEDLEELVGR